MPISWNEIRTRAITFRHDWADATDEHADAQSFWNELFNVFGVDRKRVGTFERRVTKCTTVDGSWRRAATARTAVAPAAFGSRL